VVLAILAILILPAAAAGNGTVSDTVAIRQAHLAWTALDKEYEMSTAVTYCGTLYGSDTSGMNRLLAEFKAEEAIIPGTTTSGEVDTLIGKMRNTTAQFSDETLTVMTKGQGKWESLEAQILDAKDNNPYIQAKKENYWTVRTAAHLATFDTWAGEGQQRLDTLKSAGYDTTTAQRALDVFSAKRPELKAALDKKSEAAVKTVNQQAQQLSQEFIQKLQDVQEQVPDSTRFQFFIDQGYRGVSRCDTANAALLPVILDLGDAETVLKKTKTDLANAQRMLNSRSLVDVKAPLRQVQKDLSDLAQAYRDIASTTALPEDLSRELNTLALRLDNTSDQMRDAL
jgi:hypothetical protein